MQQTSNKIRGFTLIELMLGLVVAGILASISLPALAKLIESTQMHTARNALIVSLNQARMAAITRKTQVAVCPSADGSHCADNTSWHKGWLVFVDTDQNGERANNEPVVGMTSSQGTDLAIVSSSGRDHVTYRPDGAATGSNLTLTFCDGRGSSYASTLVVNNAGRVRSGNPSTNQAETACAAVRS